MTVTVGRPRVKRCLLAAGMLLATAMLLGCRPATPSATVLPGPEPTAAASRTPSHTIAGPLHIDGKAGRVYAAGSGRTLVFDARDGRQVATVPVAGHVALDAPRHRLFVDHGQAGLAMVDTGTLSITGRIALPTPDSADNSAWHQPREEYMFGIPSVPPLVIPASGEVLVFRDASALVIDPVSGSVRRRLDDLVPGNPNVIRRAALSADGETLYVTKYDTETPAYLHNTALAAWDLTTGEMRFQQGVFGQLEILEAGPRGLLTSAQWTKSLGGNLLEWSELGLRARLDNWPHSLADGVHDSTRRRVILSIPQESSPGMLAVLSDGSSDEDLHMLYLAEPPTDGRLAGYDPVSDLLYFVFEGALSPAPAVRVAPRAPLDTGAMEISDFAAIAPAVSPAWSLDKTLVRVAMLARPPCELSIVSSIDGGLTWRPSWAGLPPCVDPWSNVSVDRISRVTFSPDFAEDQTLFTAFSQLGLFRSVDGGRLWAPAGRGMASMTVEQVSISPDFGRDRTVFAVTYPEEMLLDPGTGEPGPPRRTAWRSRDGGQSWQSIGAFNALALSPRFAQDRTMHAFRFRSTEVFRSEDAGDHWVRVGGLPVATRTDQGKPMEGLSLTALDAGGGQPHVLLAQAASGWQMMSHTWPNLDHTIFRSADGGRSWERVMEGRSFGSGSPIDVAPEGSGRALLALMVPDRAREYPPPENQPQALRSDDLGASWYAVVAPGDRTVRSLTALPDGQVMVEDGEGALSTHALTGFVPFEGPTPTPTRSSFFPVGPAATEFHALHAVEEPAPVALSRQEAIDRVLPWFLPEQEARVEAVTFVSNWDFWEAIDQRGGSAVDRSYDGLSIRTSDGHIGAGHGGPSFVMAIVEVEAGPPRQPAADFSIAPSWNPWLGGTPEARDGARRRLSYLFNATTGESMGSPWPVGQGLDPAVLDALRPQAMTVAAHPARPSPTATIDATASAEASQETAVPTSPTGPGWPLGFCLPRDAAPPEPLLADEVPAPLAETMRWLPYIEGASWEYEQTIERNGVQWVRGARREAAQGRWRIGPDAMVVRLTGAYTLTLPALDQDHGEMQITPRTGSWTAWEVVLPGGSFGLDGCEDGGFSLTERHAFLEARGKGAPFSREGGRGHQLWLDWGIVLEPQGWTDLGQLALGEYTTGLYPDGAAGRAQRWQGPDGPMEGCRAFTTHGGRYASHEVLCPGVGRITRVESGPAIQGMFWLTHAEAIVSHKVPRWHGIP